MPLSRRKFIGRSAAAGLAVWQASDVLPARAALDAGTFQPSWDSLQNYQCPEWFRDAKFGIWAHWTAQCVPEMGDWYARQMYIEGNDDYNYQVAHYGHPSRVGFKDIDHIWHAEHWDPERLIGLYKAAGARYFVALANHHDNFDCFDSRYQPWNSVKIGPKKDIVGMWARAARQAGLRFGTTVHASHAWSWYEVAQGADTKGPLAGVPYDGRLTREDGKGLWWEGLDPQDLYAQNHVPGKGLVWDWQASQGSSTPDRAYCEKFFNRTIDLIDRYQPDLLYFDDNVLPLYQVSDVGLRIAAHYYNSNMQRHGGRLEAVLNGKGLDEQQRKAMVWDFERGRSSEIEPGAWQTDTCIGNWHYQRSLYENHQYKTTEQVVRMLVDIVSKNGNLLLNIPVRGDGTIDDDELKFLQGMAAWMDINHEAIYSTRPWKISGEGPIKIRGGGFSEGGEDRLTAQDFRFTTRADTLYATALGWPDSGKYLVRTLASGASGIQGGIRSVRLLGSREKLPWARTANGLEVTLPAQRPCDHAWVLKIEGLNLRDSAPVVPVAPPPTTVRATPEGTLTLLPDAASLRGDSIQVEQHGDFPNIGFWNDARDAAVWKVHFDAPGAYAIDAKVSAANGATAFVIVATSFVLNSLSPAATLQAPATGGWSDYRNVMGGDLQIPTMGDYLVTARPADPAAWKPMNLASITLRRAP